MTTADIYEDMLSQVSTVMDLANADDIDPSDWINFGLMNSHLYRERFLKLCAKEKLKNKEMLMVLTLSVAIRSKKRIQANIGKFSGKTWHANVKKFIDNKIVQSPKEAKSENLMPIVNIANCMPSHAFYIWCKMHTFTNDDDMYDMATRSKDGGAGLFFVQLNLHEDIVAECETKEKEFWTNTVTKGGDTYEKGFHQNYFDTKKADKYHLVNKDATKVVPADSDIGYTKAEITKYLMDNCRAA